ncbi:type II toxin-antitoxin system Phd/YefM family antitoxin [Larkinella sp. VNQ87]|uniref:type II toxin-antitoxin system Phd/YefM family antitoxin n=1 Tax=Larkinella sp. VNQ87 TaxID=3400921 RepID=UPI003BFDCF41
MQVLNYTDFRKNLREKFDDVTDNGDTVIVNRTDNKAVVILSLTEYNSWIETMHLLRSEKNRQRLLNAISRSEEGDHQSHDLIEE